MSPFSACHAPGQRLQYAKSEHSRHCGMSRSRIAPNSGKNFAVRQISDSVFFGHLPNGTFSPMHGRIVPSGATQSPAAPAPQSPASGEGLVSVDIGSSPA
jgi:hypothetical protein